MVGSSERAALRCSCFVGLCYCPSTQAARLPAPRPKRQKKCRNVPSYSTLSLWAEGFIRSQRGELTGHQVERCDLLSPGEYLTDIKSKMHRFLRWPEKNLFSMFLYQMHENGLESRL